MKTVFTSIIRYCIAVGLTASASVLGQPTILHAQQAETAGGEHGVSASSTASSNSSRAGTAGSKTGYRIESSDDGESGSMMRVWHDDRLLATYQSDLKGTPGFYPLLSPAGHPLTRNFPMKPFGAAKENADVASRFEKHDHPHHRSMWFDHGDVNGIDFWALKSSAKIGRVKQTSADATVSQSSESTDGMVKSSASCQLTTSNDWIGPDGKRVLRDERKFRFHEHLGDTILDVTVKLIASDGDVTFGDTKEGSLGVRMAGTIKTDAKLGGEIHNADGFKDDDTWGKVSNWVDYSGPIAPKELPKNVKKVSAKDAADWAHAGITMMYHPANELAECYWHVRSYGLFAANPFGRHHFGAPAYDGVKIQKDQSLTLHFRLVLHDGAFDEQKTQQHFEAYAAEKVN